MCPVWCMFTNTLLYRNILYRFVTDLFLFFTPQATVEPVVYAALSSSQPRKKVNTTATVDQHQVTYATVDVNATRKQEAKAATLPTSPTGESECVNCASVKLIFLVRC